MVRLNHPTLIALSGAVWLIVGGVLLPLGLNFLVASILKDNLAHLSHPLISLLAPLTGSADSAALVAIALALFIGHLKSRTIFKKSVDASVERILTLPNPAPLQYIYTKKYYLLLASMIFIGFIVRFLPLDIRGFIDVAIGAALINGAVFYFKAAYKVFQANKSRVGI